MPAMKILFFAGSTRRHSYNRQLARQASAMATASGAEAMLLELGDLDIPMYNADLEARGTPLDVVCLKQLLWEHPAWIVCSPEYNGSYPALLKNTLDWASSPVAGHATWSDGTLPFRGKVVGMLSASNGRMGGLRAQGQLAPLLRNLGCWVAPQAFAVPGAASAFDKASGALTDPAHRDGVRAVVDQVLWAAGRLQGNKPAST